MKKKIAIFCGNISTYHCPFFKKLSKKIDLIVFFGSDLNVKPEYNSEHNTTISYDTDSLLSGYKYHFLKNYFHSPLRRGFLSRINLSLPYEIWKTNPTHIIIYGYDTLSSWLFLISGIVLQKKIIWRGEAIKGRKNSLIKTVFKKILLKFFFKLCHYVLYACKKNYDYLIQYNHSKKMHFFPCSVDNSYFRSLYYKHISNLDIIKSEYGINNEKINILFVGRITTRKNVFGILKSYNALPKIYKNKLQLIIVGSGTEKKNLINYSNINNLNIKFLDFLDHKSLSKIYTVADFFCINSDYDASPKVINEAMNFKTPVISKKTVGTSGDLILHNYNGFIFEDNKELQSIFVKIVDSFNDLDSMKENCIKILDEKFNYDVCINNLISITEKN